MTGVCPCCGQTLREKIDPRDLPSLPLELLVAHHAMLNGDDPIEAARRFAILAEVEVEHARFQRSRRP